MNFLNTDMTSPQKQYKSFSNPNRFDVHALQLRGKKFTLFSRKNIGTVIEATINILHSYLVNKYLYSIHYHNLLIVLIY